MNQGIYLGQNTQISNLNKMELKLCDEIRSLRYAYSIVYDIVDHSNMVLEDIDFINYFQDFALDKYFQDIVMEEEHRSEYRLTQSEIDSFFGFSEPMKLLFREFIHRYRLYIESGKAQKLFFVDNYWTKLECLQEWINLKNTCISLLPLFQSYLEEAGIIVEKRL